MVRPKLSLETVRKAFDERDYRLLALEQEYEDNRSKLRYVCPNHPNEVSEIGYGYLQKGYGCKHCEHDRNLAEAHRDFAARGYELFAETYRGTGVKMNYRCKQHPHEVQAISLSHLRKGNGCLKCGHEKRREIITDKADALQEVPKSKYTKASRQSTRKRAIAILDDYCSECPFRFLEALDDVVERCYEQCKYGKELRKCGAIMAGENVTKVESEAI